MAVPAQWIAVPYPGRLRERLGVAGVRRMLAIPGLDGVHLRVALSARQSADVHRLAEQTIDAGLALGVHAWVGRRAPDGSACPTPADGREQGRLLALAERRLGATEATANAERDVWRGRLVDRVRRRAYPGAVPFLEALADSYAEAAGVYMPRPGADPLGYCGFAAPHVYYLDAPRWGRVQQLYEARDVMAYQSSLRAIRRTLDRADRAWDGHDGPLHAWAGVGRVDRLGRVVGDAEAWATLAAEGRVDRIVWYVGAGAEGQVHEGHRRHEAVATLIPRIAGEAVA